LPKKLLLKPRGSRKRLRRNDKRRRPQKPSD
jgi:hypothetical protein